ncbi:hypothetical protein [Mucilaginibacter sp. HD30]
MSGYKVAWREKVTINLNALLSLYKCLNLINSIIMAKALERELLQYILQLDEAEKKSVLQMLKTFLKGREKAVSRISVEQYNKEIDEAIARVEAGDFYTQAEVAQMAKDW